MVQRAKHYPCILYPRSRNVDTGMEISAALRDRVARERLDLFTFTQPFIYIGSMCPSMEVIWNDVGVQAP